MKKLSSILLLVIVLSSCKKDEPAPPVTIDKESVEVNYDKEHQFELKQGAADFKESDFAWVSSDPNVGTISAEGLFKARKVGTTNISGTSNVGLGIVGSAVTVKPYSNLIVEPFLQFGAPGSMVRSEEKRSFADKTGDILLFNGDKPGTRFVAYLFEAGKLSGVMILLENTTTIATETGLYYRERYPKSAVVDRSVVLLDDSGKFGVIVSVHPELGLNALYTTNDGGRKVPGASTSVSALERLVEKVEGLK